MFGYVKPLISELKVKEYNLFKSYYCSLCFSIKKNFGNIPRMTLNYDMTFLAILLDSLNEDKLEFKTKNCFLHPTSKKPIILNNKSLNYSSYMNISLVYFKLLDDVMDDKNLKSKGFSLILYPYKKKFPKSINLINDIIKENLNMLNKLETNKNFQSLDEICDPFGKIVGKILEMYPEKITEDSQETRRNLYNLGYFLGKWIYLIDALDDLEDDINKNKFNPINYLFNKNTLDYNSFIKTIQERLEFNILNCSYNLREYLNKLPVKKNKSILENIVNLGMMDKYLKLINKNKGSDLENESI